MEWDPNTIPRPPPEVEQKTPFDYFSLVWEEDLYDIIADQANLYAFQKSTLDLQVTAVEIQQFIGILVYTGIVPMLQYRMYWANDTRFPHVADVMTRNRFDEIVRHFHIVYNETHVPGADKLFKTRRLINSIVEVCRRLPSEEKQSVDELMIPLQGHLPIETICQEKA